MCRRASSRYVLGIAVVAGASLWAGCRADIDATTSDASTASDAYSALDSSTGAMDAVSSDSSCVAADAGSADAYSFPCCPEDRSCRVDGIGCALKSIAAKYGSCASDDDCMMAALDPSCVGLGNGSAPPYPVSTAGAPSFKQEGQAEITRYCTINTGCHSSVECAPGFGLNVKCSAGRCQWADCDGGQCAWACGMDAGH